MSNHVQFEDHRRTGDGDVPALGAPVPVGEVLDFAAEQVRALMTAHPGVTPTYTEGGRWVIDADPWAPTWSGGFLTGMAWMFAKRTGDPWWEEQARTYSRLIEHRKNDTGTHDIGFLLEPSWGRWYDYTGESEAREVLITGGRTMAARFQPNGEYLSTWVAPGSTFIDIMMNVGIIYRAAEYSGDDRLRRIATLHSLSSRRHLQRGDGSVIHEGWFDTGDGQFLRADTHQGWRPDSSWARGTAWAIYGFTTAYTWTQEQRFLVAARNAADYFIAATDATGVPPNDWLDPAPPTRWEASAAAIASAGMLRLAAAMGATTPHAGTYRDYGLTILRSLRTPHFLGRDTPGYEGILKHAIYHQRNGLGIDQSVMWGEHYFVEALVAAEELAATQAQGSAS